MAVVTTNLGVITAYGDAVAAGYRGTKAEWQALMANYATVGQQAAQDAQTASTAAQTATTKAGEASQSATRAETAAASITTPDATLTQAGVAADAKATGDEISDLKEGFTNSITESLYDPASNRNAVYYRTGGIIAASSAWNASKLYELEDGHEYYYSGLNNLGIAPVNCYFDSNKNYLDEFSSATGMQFLDIPSGAKYVAFSIKNEDASTFELNSIVDAKLLLDNYNELEHVDANTAGIYSDGTQGVELGSLTGAVEQGITETDSTTRIRTGYLINKTAGTNVSLAEGYSARTFVFDRYFNILSVSAWSKTVFVSKPSRLIRLVLKKDDDSTVSLADYTTAFNGYFDDYIQVIDVRAKVSKIENDVADMETKPTLIASIENSAWSWWMYPQVVVNENYRRIAAFGEVDSSGIAGIGQINLDTEQELKINVWEAGRDDHNGMAILQVDSEHFLIAGAKHSEENYLHLWRSMNRNSLDVLNPEVVIEFPDSVTYAQLFRTPNNKVVLFCRVGVVNWYCCYSKDAYGEEWNEPFKLISSTIQYYCMFRPTTDSNIIHVAMYSNPNWTTTDTRIRFAYYDITNKILYDLGGNALTTEGGYVPYTDVGIVVDIPNYSPTGTTRNRLLDVAITAPREYAILYCRFTNENDGIYYANINGRAYRIADAGGCFYTPSCYYGGAIFVPKDASVIYLSRYYNNRYHLEKYVLTNGEYTLAEEIDSSNNDGLMYPVCRPIIDVDGKVLFYQKGCTMLTSFQRYSYDAKFMLLTEG